MKMYQKPIREQGKGRIKTYPDTSLDGKVNVQLVLELGSVSLSGVIRGGEGSPIEVISSYRSNSVVICCILTKRIQRGSTWTSGSQSKRTRFRLK